MGHKCQRISSGRSTAGNWRKPVNSARSASPMLFPNVGDVALFRKSGVFRLLRGEKTRLALGNRMQSSVYLVV